MIRLIVAGSRDITNYNLVENAIDRWIKDRDLWFYDVEIVSGVADGVDSLAVEFAWNQRILVAEFPALWNKHGKRAGYLRNVEMAEYAHALLAVWDGKSKGTKHMIDIATSRGLDVTVEYIEEGEG